MPLDHSFVHLVPGEETNLHQNHSKFIGERLHGQTAYISKWVLFSLKIHFSMLQQGNTVHSIISAVLLPLEQTFSSSGISPMLQITSHFSEHNHYASVLFQKLIEIVEVKITEKYVSKLFLELLSQIFWESGQIAINSSIQKPWVL